VRNVDLLPHKFKVDHNPTSQIASDPSAYIENAAGPLAEIISAIPTMVIDVVTSILTDPTQLADILLQVPESFLGLSKFTGSDNIGLGALGDLGSFIPGLGLGLPIAQMAEQFITDILNPTGLLADLEGIIGAITGLDPTGLGLDSISQWAGNLESIFGGLVDFNSATFNPLTAVEGFITEMINPTGLLAPLTGGLLPLSIFPMIPVAFITGLEGMLSGFLDFSTWQGLLDGVLGTPSGTGTTGGFQNFLTGLMPLNVFQQVVDEVLGGSNNPFSAFTSFLTGTNATANNASFSATSALTQISDLATGVLGIGSTVFDLAPWLTDLFDTTQSQGTSITSLFGQFESLIDGVLGPASGGTVTDLASFIGGLLSPSSPLNALNIFGLIQPGNVGLVGVSQVGDTSPNLLTNPNFLGVGSLDGGGIFTHDATVGYPPTAPLGAAKTTANGTTRELLSNSVAATAGQVINASGSAQWASATQAAGTKPVQLAINAYSGGSLISQTILGNPLAASPATSSWQNMTGSYTIPNGVDSVRLVLRVTADATAGNFWFTNLNLSKSGLLPTNLLKDIATGNPLHLTLSGMQDNFSSIFGQLGNFLHLSDWTNFLNIFGGSTSSAQSMLNNFLTPSSTVNAAQIGGTGTIADAFVPGVTSIVDNIVTNLLGLAGSGFTHAQANDALANTSNNVVALQAQVASLNHAQTQGLAVADGFTNLNNWLLITNSGGGHWTTSGNVATWSAGFLNSSSVDSLNIWQGTGNNDKHSVGDYQQASIILNSTGGNFLGATGYIDIWLRVSDATTSLSNATGIRFRWGADGSLSITRFVNGVAAVLNSAPANTVTAPGKGVNLSCIAGKPGNARWFEMFINGTSVLSIPEIGSGSQVGTGFQNYGWGGHSSGQLLPVPGQQAPPDVHQWNGADQVAA
jgi:hypothetical protein